MSAEKWRSVSIDRHHYTYQKSDTVLTNRSGLSTIHDRASYRQRPNPKKNEVARQSFYR